LRNCRGDLLESAAYAARSWVARVGGWFRNYVTVFAPVSNSVAAYLRDLGVAGHRISVVPNPVALPAAATDAAHGDYALYVGRLSAEKGVRTLQAAMDMTDPSVRLHVVGAGPEEARVRSGASRWITFHGYLPPHAVASMYRRARFTVVPSVCEETFSLVAAESMSHAVPVIASRIGGLRELVRDGVDGVLCEPGNADALAAEMSRLWNDPAACGRMGQDARQRIAEHYSDEHSYGQLLRAYELALT
jgi:glycosyltransferase involved in cell wall biosynthesis